MSSNHKHEWSLFITDYGEKLEISCECGEEMTIPEAERRIDATEEMSAKDARHILRLHAANENDDMWILNAYAERMEDA